MNYNETISNLIKSRVSRKEFDVVNEMKMDREIFYDECNKINNIINNKVDLELFNNLN